jgi:hypothetical protein
LGAVAEDFPVQKIKVASIAWLIYESVFDAVASCLLTVPHVAV